MRIVGSESEWQLERHALLVAKDHTDRAIKLLFDCDEMPMQPLFTQPLGELFTVIILPERLTCPVEASAVYENLREQMIMAIRLCPGDKLPAESLFTDILLQMLDGCITEESLCLRKPFFVAQLPPPQPDQSVPRTALLVPTLHYPFV